MKKNILFFVVIAISLSAICGTPKSIYTPFPTKENAKKILERKVIIEKREMNEKTAAKLQKKDPETFKFETEYNEFFNSSIIDFFDKNYNGSKSIELKTTSEIENIFDSKSDQYTVIRVQNMKRSFNVSGQNKYFDTYSFCIFLPELEYAQLIISFNGDILNDVDFIFLVQQINNILARAIEDKGSIDFDVVNKEMAPRLKDLKLLITDENLNEKLSLDAIKKEYTLDIEHISDLKEYTDIILNKKPGYAYIACAFSPITWGPCFFAVESETGDILSSLSLGGVTFEISTRPSKASMPRFSSERDRRDLTIDLFTFRPKILLKPVHFKYLNKFATQQ